MNQTPLFGFYLFHKAKAENLVLKELIQLLRHQNPGKALNFTYIEPGSSLLPNLTLWENIHVATGGASWKDFSSSLSREWASMANLIESPNKPAHKAEPWEKFLIELLKGLSTDTKNILIDINENKFSQLNLENIKKILNKVNQSKPIFLATSNTNFWSESCHGIITKVEYEFKIELLDQKRLAKPAA